MIYFSLNKSNGTEDTVYEKEDQVPYSKSFYCSTAPNRPVLRLSLQKPVQRTNGFLPQKPARGGCRKAITRIQEHAINGRFGRTQRLSVWNVGAISGRRILPILPSFTAILTVLLNTSLEVKHSEAPFRRTKRSVKAASSEYK